MDTNNLLQPEFNNDTVLHTPQPSASSTVVRPRVSKEVEPRKVPLDYSVDATSDSLGILSLNKLSLDCDSYSQLTSKKLQQQRDLANSVLQTTKNLNLPSRYLRPSESISCDSLLSKTSYESTVSESDLIRQRTLFTPTDVSTPRSSNTSDLSINPRISIGKMGQSMKDSLKFLSDNISNTDISLPDLYNEFYKRHSIIEESFASGDLALAKIAKEEVSWKRERCTLGENSLKSDSIFTQFDSYAGGSISEFFKKKSELAELCLKDSPEKEEAPTPLIDPSTLQDESDFLRNVVEPFKLSASFNDSTLSVSEIENAISASDNTTRIMSMLGKVKIKENASTKTKNKKSLESQEKRQSSYKENKSLFKNCSSSCKRLSNCLQPLKDSHNNVVDKSVYSLRTASSLDTLPGGKLPIEVNKIELIWGCVPVGGRKVQTFVLRNKTQNKLTLQLSSSSPSFKILKDNSEADLIQCVSILLHPSESRLFSIMFSPSIIGAMTERLAFSPVNIELQLKQTRRQQLNLFGYGGYARIEILDVPKDVTTKMWLSLGKIADLCSSGTTTFRIRNTGSLSAFAYLESRSKAVYGYTKTVVISPAEVIVKPGEDKIIKVCYTPTKDELTHFLATTKNQVIEIGYIHLTIGEEPLRGRIRRLCKKLKNEGGNLNNSLIERLTTLFPGEKMPIDIKTISETVGSMKELMQNLVSQEIILTLERGVDGNMVEHIIGIDQSSTFHSLIEGMPTFIGNSTSVNMFIVEPTNIVLTPPTKNCDNVLVMNNTGQALQFQTLLSNIDLLEVSPCEGILQIGETVLLKITCDTKKLQKQQQQKQLFKLSIYVDDDVYEVDIKTILLKQKSNK